MDLIVDFLVDDATLDKAAGQLRKEFPRLPEGCEFVTYVQAPFEAEINGIVRAVPSAAVIGIKVPNPRRPQLPKLHRASWPLSAFRAMQQSFDRIVGYPDPVLHALRRLAPQAIDWYETMRDLNGPVEGFDDLGKAGFVYSTN